MQFITFAACFLALCFSAVSAQDYANTLISRFNNRRNFNSNQRINQINPCDVCTIYEQCIPRPNGEVYCQALPGNSLRGQNIQGNNLRNLGNNFQNLGNNFRNIGEAFRTTAVDPICGQLPQDCQICATNLRSVCKYSYNYLSNSCQKINVCQDFRFGRHLSQNMFDTLQECRSYCVNRQSGSY